MNKRLLAVFFGAIAIILFSFPIYSYAEPDITLDSTAGFQNKMKQGRGAPVQITAINNGTAFSGDLILNYSESYNLGAGMAIPLELAAGETKTIQLAVPGLVDNNYMGPNQAQSIFLYEEGWENGESIDFTGSKLLQPSFFGPTSLFIGTLTENQDRLLKMGQISPTGIDSTQVFHLNQADEMELPSESIAWDALDYLVIDEFAYSDLPEAVQEAVLEWLKQGGDIIVGSSSNISASMGNIADFLPLNLSSPVDVSVPGFENPIPAFNATIKEEAVVLLENEGQILVAQQNIGAGTITQTSFSLGDSTVTSQENYVDFAGEFLIPDSSTINIHQGQSFIERISYDLGNTNELFESFAVSKTLMSVIILLYIIVIVPVLYAVLKRKDKREFAWIVIPAIAIVTSIGVFALGAKDRIASPQIQQTGFFEVDKDKGLNGYYMSSLLSNRGGDYQFISPDSTQMTYLHPSDFSNGTSQNAAILEKKASEKQLTVRDMRYWSVASVLGHSYIEGSGNFNIQFEVKDRKVTGFLKNDFPFAVQDAAIWTGTRMIALGDLNPGQEITIDESLPTDILHSISPIGRSAGIQPVSNTEDLMEARKQAALTSAFDTLSESRKSPYVVAFTNEAIVPVTLNDQRSEVSALNLIAQSFEPATSLNGEISLESEDFAIELTGKTPNAYVEPMSDDSYFYGVHEGEYRLTYQLPSAINSIKAQWSNMNILLTQANAEFSILNIGSGEFEPISSNEQQYTENITDYITKDGVIELALLKNGQTGYSEMSMPKIELKGVVAP